MTTELTYWNNKGRYQDAYDKIWKCLIPKSGEASNPHAEAVRCISRIYYDYFNNGFCNAIEDDEWTDFYEDMIYYVYEYLEYATLDTIESNAILKGTRNDSKIADQLEKLVNEILQKAIGNLNNQQFLHGFISKTTTAIRNFTERMETAIAEGRINEIEGYARWISQETDNLKNALENGI